MERIERFLRIFVLFAAVLVWVTGVALAQEKNVIAMIQKINGKLEYRTSPNEDWKPAKQLDPLYNGYQLRTGTGDKALIMYTGQVGNRVLINENTTIEIEAVADTPGGKPKVERTKLMIGEIYSRIKAGNNYEVETPSSVASVRGTQFDSSYLNGEATYIGVEGIIQIMNELGSVLLERLQMTKVQLNQAPSPVVTLTEDELKKKTAWTETVEPNWKLNMIPEGGTDQQVNAQFTLAIQALKKGTVDTNAFFTLTEFGADASIVEYSKDGGKTWSGQTPTINLINGLANLLVRLTGEGTTTITARAENAETATLAFKVGKVKGKKVIEFKFTNPDGSGEKTLILEFEEK